VDQDVWTVFMEAPEYHFAKARESLANNDTHTTAAELREGAFFLRFQAERLDASVNDLFTLADQVNAGQVKPGAGLDDVLARADKSLDYRESLVPIVQGEDELLADSSNYHVVLAKKKIESSDRADAAREIRKAIAYVKLEAARAGRKVSGDLKSALDDMEKLSKKVESGTDVTAKDLDQAFAKARKAIKKGLKDRSDSQAMTQ
jgi:hypothetical protein